MKGTIKNLNPKGFGFIAREGEGDLFFHSNNLVGVDFADLKVGDVLSFGIEDSPKGQNATNVERA